MEVEPQIWMKHGTACAMNNDRLACVCCIMVNWSSSELQEINLRPSVAEARALILVNELAKRWARNGSVLEQWYMMVALHVICLSLTTRNCSLLLLLILFHIYHGWRTVGKCITCKLHRKFTALIFENIHKTRRTSIGWDHNSTSVKVQFLPAVCYIELSSVMKHDLMVGWHQLTLLTIQSLMK